MKASNRWSVLKSADKSDEEIIKSFSVKQNDRIYMERRKDTIMTPMDPFVITNIFYNLDLWLWSLKLGNKPG
jgi:penicillin-binding protein 1A